MQLQADCMHVLICYASHSFATFGTCKLTVRAHLVLSVDASMHPASEDEASRVNLKARNAIN
jgi:hypothetical protein